MGRPLAFTVVAPPRRNVGAIRRRSPWAWRPGVTLTLDLDELLQIGRDRLSTASEEWIIAHPKALRN